LKCSIIAVKELLHPEPQPMTDANPNPEVKPRGADQRASIPLTVIAGYLGAGKTTVLTHLLRSRAAGKIAVLVNDFDRMRIDESLIRWRARNTLRLANGCIYCRSSEALAEALAKLRRQPRPPEHVLVEAAATGDIQQIGQFGFLPGYTLDGIIDVTDAESLRVEAADPSVGSKVMSQLQTADLIILNKADLVSRQEKQEICDWLKQVIPDARIVEASYGRLPPELLLGRHPASDARLRRRAGREQRAEPRLPHEVGYSSCSWTSEEPINENAFYRWAGELSPTVLRAKGILHFRSHPGSRFVFHLIGARWSMHREGPWGRERPRTVISLLARAGTLPRGWLEMTLRRDDVFTRKPALS
jgi:G3E family GTPase